MPNSSKSKNSKRKLENDDTKTCAAKISKKAEAPEPEIKIPAKAASDAVRGARLESEFYDKDCLELSKALIGKKLVRKLDDGTIVSGLIVETEGYLGKEDPSAHSYKGQTDRNHAMFMAPGTSYVYNIYGAYCCMNISSRGEGHAVLLRSLDPCEGIETMRKFRAGAKKSPQSIKDKDLCSGPSKFCQALDIQKATINELDMTKSDKIWLENGDDIPEEKIVISTRIGIEGAGVEAASKPYRFYALDNVHVSKRDKIAEAAYRKNKCDIQWKPEHDEYFLDIKCKSELST